MKNKTKEITSSLKNLAKNFDLIDIEKYNFYQNMFQIYMDNVSDEEKTECLIDLLKDNEHNIEYPLNINTLFTAKESYIKWFKEYINSLENKVKVNFLDNYKFEDKLFKEIFDVDRSFKFKDNLFNNYIDNIPKFNYDNKEMLDFLLTNFKFYIENKSIVYLSFYLENTINYYATSDLEKKLAKQRKEFFHKLLKLRFTNDTNFESSKSVVKLIVNTPNSFVELENLSLLMEYYITYSNDKERILEVVKFLYELDSDRFSELIDIFKSRFEKEYTKLVINNL